MPHAAIIIPCYNEALRLPKDKIIQFAETNKNIQICLVNDGSKDDTWDLLQKMKYECPNLMVINNKKNQGKAETVRKTIFELFQQHQFDYYGYFDADLSTPLSEIQILINIAIDKNKILVMASRIQRLGSNIKRKFLRHIIGRVFATCASNILHLKVYDTQCGAKIFNANIIPFTFDQPFISRWLFDIEFIARIINKYGLSKSENTVYEHPIDNWEDIDGSKLKLTDFIKFPLELWNIYKTYKIYQQK